MKEQDKIIEKFFYSYHRVIKENNVVRSFLKEEDNFILVKEAILNPTFQNKRNVDNLFKAHYRHMKLMKYISKLIYFYSIDYDKKINKLNKRFILTLDQEMGSDSSGTFFPKDYIESETHLSYELAFGSSLIENIGEESLQKALGNLTDQQLRILEMIYLENLSLKEISCFKNTSAQNIANQHRKAIRKLRSDMGKGELYAS